MSDFPDQLWLDVPLIEEEGAQATDEGGEAEGNSEDTETEEEEDSDDDMDESDDPSEGPSLPTRTKQT